ncbi:DNA cytosine methyltransferase [Mycoplasmatota bacterium WC30]
MYRVLDLFSGAGGFSSGFIKAGFKVLAANEIDQEIASTYIHNHPDTIMHIGDIASVKNDLFEYQNIDVVIGGPPCQGFSLAGARNRTTKHERFMNDERNYLFREYLNIVIKTRPKVIIIENVIGLVSMKDGEILNEIINILSDDKIMNNQYNVEWKIINMSEYGIPQNRLRVFIVGIDSSINRGSFFAKLIKKREDKTIIRDWIFDLRNEKTDGTSSFYNHVQTKHSKIAIERMKKIKQGQNYLALNDDKIKSVHSGAYGRMRWDSQSKTITTRFDTPSGGEYIHPEFHRTITPREAARIQTFDDDYEFLGNKSSITKQIGNAVPPKMSNKIALTVKEILK